MAGTETFPYLRRAPLLQEYPVSKTVALNVGDAVWFDAPNNTLKPLSSFAWDTDEQTTRKKALPYFVGISAISTTGREATDTKAAVVQSGAIFQITLATSGTHEPGDLIGFSSASNQLRNTVYTKVSNPLEACGQIVKRYTSSTSVVEAVIWSAKELANDALGHIRELVIPLSQRTNVAADLLTNYTWLERVKMVDITAIVKTATSATQTLSLKNGAVTIATLVISNTTPAGAFVRKDISGAATNTFEPLTTMTLVGESTATNIDGTVILRAFVIPA